MKEEQIRGGRMGIAVAYNPFAGVNIIIFTVALACLVPAWLLARSGAPGPMPALVAFLIEWVFWYFIRCRNTTYAIMSAMLTTVSGVLLWSAPWHMNRPIALLCVSVGIGLVWFVTYAATLDAYRYWRTLRHR